MRLRKAWEIFVKGLQHDRAIYFAPTASKARYQGYLSAREAYDTIKLTDVRVIRAADRDVALPEPEPILADLSEDERHCLLHSFGANSGDPYKAGYRDYFYTREDDAPLVGLVARGLMTGPHKPHASMASGDMAYFYLNDAGKRAALSAVPVYAR